MPSGSAENVDNGYLYLVSDGLMCKITDVESVDTIYKDINKLSSCNYVHCEYSTFVHNFGVH